VCAVLLGKTVGTTRKLVTKYNAYFWYLGLEVFCGIQFSGLMRQAETVRLMMVMSKPAGDKHPSGWI
jgi:hypothetical protein